MYAQRRYPSRSTSVLLPLNVVAKAVTKLVPLVLLAVVMVSTLTGCSKTELKEPSADSSADVVAEDIEVHPFVAELTEEMRRETVIWDLDTASVEHPDNWNPFLPESRREKGFHQAMIEPLFILNYETGVIEPWLATNMTANNTMDVWTLTLRQGVQWSDGEPFNADDVVFTIQAMIDEPGLDAHFGVTKWIKALEKVDDLTVRFTLTGPNPRFQADYFAIKFWGGFPIIPEHIWGPQTDRLTFKNYDPEQGWPVFTGPYRVERISETAFVYVRNDDWWGAKSGFRPLPKPKRLMWVSHSTEAERIAMAADNHLDSLGDITLQGFQHLREQNPNIIAWFDGLPYSWMDPCSRLLSFNHTVAPWGDKDIRWAVNYAINRQEIVQRAYEGTTFESRHFFPAYPPLNRYVQLLEDQGLYDTYLLMSYDPDKARAIIESKGWQIGPSGYYEQNGTVLSMEIQLLDGFVEKRKVAEVLAEQLGEVGIDTSIRVLGNETWSTNLDLGTYEAIIDWEACGSVHEPWASLDRYHAQWVRPVGEPTVGRRNHIRWENQAYSELVDQIGELPLGDPRVDDLFVQAMEIWLEELPFIPITQAKKLIPFNTTYWEGWPTSENSYVQPPSWWQSTHLIIHQLEPVTP